jgi:hypothetical protein
MVETVVEHDKQFEVQGFDVGVVGNSQAIDYERHLKVLKYLNEGYNWGISRVANLSFVNEISFEDLNNLVKNHVNVPANYKINKNNVAENAAIIYQAIEAESRSNSPSAPRYQDLVKEIGLLHSLMQKKQVAIIISAGNSGENSVDLRGAVLADLIMVGGTKDKESPDPRSANNNTIDAWANFSSEYKISSTDVTLEGTSFAAPIIARIVADMQGFAASRNIPLSLPQINQSLREEFKKINSSTKAEETNDWQPRKK